jgi:hypothetical protein
MSYVSSIFQRATAFLTRKDPEWIPEPEVGMAWAVMHHHAFNFDWGYKSERLKNYYITDINEIGFELTDSDGCSNLFPHECWDEIYSKNLYKSRKAGAGMVWGGHVEPVYLGIVPLRERKFKRFNLPLTHFEGNELAVYVKPPPRDRPRTYLE